MAHEIQWKYCFLIWHDVGRELILISFLLGVLILSNYSKFKRMALIRDATYGKLKLCGGEEILLGLLDASRRRRNVRRTVGKLLNLRQMVTSQEDLDPK